MAESIYQKLSRIQNELKAPKSQFNEFGKYAYRSAEDILEAVKPIADKHGCVLYISDEISPIICTGENGREYVPRFYVAAVATLVNRDNPDEKIAVRAYAREDETKKGMDGAQITGSASSYARKYALNGLFCIDDTKDPDATNDHGKGKPKTYGNGKTKAQAKELASTQDPMQQAKARMSRAINAWAKRTGSDAKKAKQSLTGRPDYEPTPEFCVKVAEEFESIVASYAARDGGNAQG